MNSNVAFATPAALGTSAVTGGAVTCARVTARVSTARMAFTSIGGVLTDPPTSTTSSDTDTVIRTVFTQVFGNAYVMESESGSVSEAISTFVNTGDVREFVRSLAKSDEYRARFFDGVSQYRCVELLFKHVLGRAPEGFAEYAQLMAAYHAEGYDAMVDLLVDCSEYDELFGAYVVPYQVYKGQWPVNQCFNYSVALGGPQGGTSDKNRSCMLQYAICSGDAPNWLSIAKSLPAGTEKGSGFTFMSYKASAKTNKNAPVRVGTKVPGGVVFY